MWFGFEIALPLLSSISCSVCFTRFPDGFSVEQVFVFILPFFSFILSQTATKLLFFYKFSGDFIQNIGMFPIIEPGNNIEYFSQV